MVKCFFCGTESHPHIGLHLIKNDGSVQYFCSSKCRKNTMKLGRDKKKIRWTGAYDIVKEKEKVAVKKAEDKANEKKANENKEEKK